jgi:hypothetical protein
MVKKIKPARVRYIKLGRGGGWEQESLKAGILRFGFGTNRDDRFAMCEARKWEKLQDSFQKDGKDKGTATRSANEVRLFWEDKGETLWITFIEDRLCWGFLTPEKARVHKDGHGTWRRVASGWSSADLAGMPLVKSALSGALTKLAAYRGTSCELDTAVASYTVQRINGEKPAQVDAAVKALSAFQGATLDLLRLLQPKDFELLVDLIFSTSGWRRLGAVGKNQKTTDIDLMLPTTGERALVQVKSETSQAEFTDYIRRLGDSSYDRMFYIFHSGKIENRGTDNEITIIGPEKLAEMTINAGLVEWVMQKVS